MKRLRRPALVLALLLCVGRAAWAETAADWTRGVYLREAEDFNAMFEHRAAGKPGPDVFSPAFHAAQAAADAAPPPLVGPMLNFYFGWLDFQNRHVSVIGVETLREDAASAEIAVDYAMGDGRRRALVKEVRVDGALKIDDVIYEGDSARGHFRRRVEGAAY